MGNITVTIQAEGQDPEAYEISADTVASLDKMAATQVTMQPIEVPLPNGTVFKTMVPMAQCANGKDLIVQQLRDVLIQQALTQFPTSEVTAAQKALDDATAARDAARKGAALKAVTVTTPGKATVQNP